MNSQDSAVHYSCQGQVVEYFTAVSPYVAIAVLAHAFVIEAVDLCDLTRLVVASNQGDSIRVSDFQQE